MKTFEDQIKTVCDNSYKRNEGWRMLAKTRKFVGLDEHWLGAKMHIVARVIGDTLEKGYIKVGADGVIKNIKLVGNVDDLYTCVAGYVQRNLPDKTCDFTDLMFDGSEEDLRRLVNVLSFIFDFEKSIAAGVAEYKAKNDCARGDDLCPSYLKFASGFIYFHFSQTSFMYSDKINRSSALMYNAAECRLGEAIVPDEVKHGLFEQYIKLSDYLVSELNIKRIPKNRKKRLLCDYYARAYALACYLVRNNYTDFCGQYSTAIVNDIFEGLTAA